MQGSIGEALQFAERGDLGRRVGGQRQQHLAHCRGVDRDVGADAGVEAQRLRRRHVIGDQHLVADSVPRLADSPVSAARSVQYPCAAVEPEPRLGAAAEGDQPGAEVVALGVGVLGHEAGVARRLEQGWVVLTVSPVRWPAPVTPRSSSPTRAGARTARPGRPTASGATFAGTASAMMSEVVFHVAEASSTM